MKVVVNPDGSTTVSCDGSSVTINPPPGRSARRKRRRRVGPRDGLGADRVRAAKARESLVEEAGAGGEEQALVLQGQGEIDVERIRRLLDDAGLERLAIEITPTWRDG